MVHQIFLSLLFDIITQLPGLMNDELFQQVRGILNQKKGNTMRGPIQPDTVLGYTTKILAL